MSYHGRAEQTRLLRRLGLHHSRFTSPLGKVGWTLGFCRNYAVLLSLALGADLLLMVDDDIIIEDKRTVDMSFRLLGQYAVVGTRTVGMYDDSIIGHLARRLGEVQYDYITGQYAGLNLHSINYYFPNVYNEDLIFYAFQGQGKEFARSGTVRQLTKKTIGNFDSTLMFQEEGEILLIGTIEATTRGNESLLLQSDFWSVILRDRIEELCELAKLQTQHGVDSSSHPFNVLTKYHSRLQPASFVSFYRKYRRSIEPWRTILTKANNRKIEVEPIAHI